MESIETLNQRLIDHFGMDDLSRPMFRIVWSNDQFEKRLIHDIDGFNLLYPEVREVRKYPYLADLYVLERLVVVPDINQVELPTMKLSYEPIWAYRSNNGMPLPPVWSATKLIIDSLYAAMGKSSLKRYIDDEKNTTPEGREQRITELQNELFGNDTETSDAMRYHEGIVVPSTYKKDN